MAKNTAASRRRKTIWINVSFQSAAFVLALLLTTVMLLAVGAPPFQAYRSILVGAFGSVGDIFDTLIAWAPLLLTTMGVLITFSAGLWNIGIEGQVTLGAIFTTWILRLLQESGLPPWLIIVLGILAGIVGGALWASLAGVLKTFGGVNEIFGGLGLNFVATALTLWLIFGPWKRPGTGSMSGTLPFPEELWLPAIPGFRLSPWALVLSFIAVVVVYFLLRGTHFGLRLKAVGKNMRAAYLLGVPTWQHMLASFLLCGVFAGLAGALQVTAVYHRLIPSISSNYGFTGLLVAMLVNFHALWAVPVALFFAALNIGSVHLPIVLKLDSSLSGVLQGLLVLLVLMVEGARQRLMSRKIIPAEPASGEEVQS
ncbi:MAG: ABC transporter permease [Anaerolineales bacterium]|nr:ABC transporter permease [Anaerolineales bacterium]